VKWIISDRTSWLLCKTGRIPGTHPYDSSPVVKRMQVRSSRELRSPRVLTYLNLMSKVHILRPRGRQ
jgi:hypothetical protein